jgi:hypothetical protein
MVSRDIIYALSFIEIGTGIQAVLRFCLKNVTSCKIGTTDRRNL